MDLVLGHWRLKVKERLDVATHERDLQWAERCCAGVCGGVSCTARRETSSKCVPSPIVGFARACGASRSLRGAAGRLPGAAQQTPPLSLRPGQPGRRNT